MLSSLAHLPEFKQHELDTLKSLIIGHASIEMAILFGSYARGDWVSDKYVEDHVTYEYQSDYDILIIVKSEKLRDNFGIWSDLNLKIANDKSISTPVSVIVDTIDFVNQQLNEHNYFYVDIVKEGFALYDSKNYKLNEPGVLNEEQRKEIARKDYEFWMGRAESFLKDYNHNIDDSEFNNAAFHLHQTAEALYVSALLVLTGYKPKTHDLEKMEKLLIEYDEEFLSSFDRSTPQNNDRFKLLQKAYVDARYRKDYKVTINDLKFIHEQVLKIRDLVTRVCTSLI